MTTPTTVYDIHGHPTTIDLDEVPVHLRSFLRTEPENRDEDDEQ